MTNSNGWIPDQPDQHDYTLHNQAIAKLLFRSQAPAQQLKQAVQGILKSLKPLLDPIDPNLIKALQQEIEHDNGDIDRAILTLLPAWLVPIQPDAQNKAGVPTQLQLQLEGSSPLVEENKLLYLLVLSQQIGYLKPFQPIPPSYLALQDYCGRVEDQTRLKLQSCTAHACVALMECFRQQQTGSFNAPPDPSEQSASLPAAAATPPTSGTLAWLQGVVRKITNASPDSQPAARPIAQYKYKHNQAFSSRFLYKVTRLLRPDLKGDSGASLRDTLKAMLLFGVPPETIWPWPADGQGTFDDEPPAFAYAYAKNYQAVKYFRLDRDDIDRATLLAQIKVALLANFPVVFGFRLFSQMTYSESIIPYPQAPISDVAEGENILGHAVLAIGYDDDKEIPGLPPGAIYFKNSWGKDWGEAGYGWLPYAYILNATEKNYLTRDWWTLLDASWAQTEQFGLRPDEDGKLTLLMLGSDRNKPKTGGG